MIGHADAQAACNPPEENRNQQGFPGEKEERCNGPDMKQSHESCRDPVDFVFRCLRFFQILQLHFQGWSPFSVFRFLIRLPLPLTYQGTENADCNSCVIAAFAGITRVTKRESGVRSAETSRRSLFLRILILRFSALTRR